MQPFAAIVVAAGQGTRASQDVPKQFANYRGRPLVAHSVGALAEAGADPILVAIPKGYEVHAAQALADFPAVKFVIGGATRQESVYRALEELAELGADQVLIHDAARPDIPRQVIVDLLSELDQHHGAVPVLPMVDSLVQADDNVITGTISRDLAHRVQTPQAFQFHAALGAHRGWTGAPDATDDSQVVVEAGGSVAIVEGDEALKKITHAQDFTDADAPAPVAFPRTGIGYDVHALEEGESLWLCGVELEHTHGLAGHSDADVGIHALVDALLGALAAGDIGDHFPPSDPQWQGAASSAFLEHAVALAKQAGYHVGNVDVTLICEAPKIGPHRSAMRERLAQIMAVDTSCVSVKATTTESLGFTGRREGIAAQAVATIIPV